MKSSIKTLCAVLTGEIDGTCKFLIEVPDAHINQRIDCLKTIQNNAMRIWNEIQNLKTEFEITPEESEQIYKDEKNYESAEVTNEYLLHSNKTEQ